MSKKKKNVFKLINEINKGAEKEKGYGTGLLGEHIIVASYRKMPIDKLEKMRVIINNLIREKKAYKNALKAK